MLRGRVDNKSINRKEVLPSLAAMVTNSGKACNDTYE